MTSLLTNLIKFFGSFGWNTDSLNLWHAREVSIMVNSGKVKKIYTSSNLAGQMQILDGGEAHEF